MEMICCDSPQQYMPRGWGPWASNTTQNMMSPRKNTMQRNSTGSKLVDGPHDFDSRERALKVKISRENANSRRFSASNFKSFRENRRSFGSNVTISSTVSSPGYTIRDEISPSTYSFTNALKALQERAAREYLSPDNGGLSLSSKWNDAEKYICNPLSGQVPLQCLSSMALMSESPSQRLTTSRITLTAPPLICQNHHFQTKSSAIPSQNQVRIVAIQEDKRSTTRDVGTQIRLGSEISIPAPNPSIQENSTKPSDQEKTGPSPVTSKILKTEAKVEKERGDRRKRKKVEKMTKSICSHKGKGCLSFIRIWRHKTRNQNNNNATYLCHVNASFQQ